MSGKGEFLILDYSCVVLLVFTVTSSKIKIKTIQTVGVHPIGHQHDVWKPIETSVDEFYYESINSSLKELINIKVKLRFSDTMGAQRSSSPKISHFFNLQDSSLGRHVNAAPSKSLEIQAHCITKRSAFSK